MAKAKSETGEILEIVNFIKDHMATRDEMNEAFLEVNGRLVSIEQELKDIKRRLTNLEDNFERAKAVNRGEVEALWKRVAAIEKHLKMQR